MPATCWRQELNRLLEEKPVPEGQYASWRAELKEQEAKFPLAFPQRDDVIVPQWAIKVLNSLVHSAALVGTGWPCLGQRRTTVRRSTWCVKHTCMHFLQHGLNMCELFEPGLLSPTASPIRPHGVWAVLAQL